MRAIQYIPRATEKAYALQTQTTYIFYVPRSASKQEIAQKVADEFKVTVVSVRTALRKGKPTRFSRGKHAYPGITTRQDHKVAYITLKEGDKIPVFEEQQETNDKKSAKAEDKKDKKSVKEDKKTAKEEKKVAKKAEKQAKEDK